jgi:hypothetical protein
LIYSSSKVTCVVEKAKALTTKEKTGEQSLQLHHE